MPAPDAGGGNPPPAKVREPIPVGPFLEFCARREAVIRGELDGVPAIATGSGCDPAARLVMSLGWDADNGLRKLNRWRHPEQGDGHSGWVDRADVEDAVRNAGGDFDELYPDLPPPAPYYSRLGAGRYMTDRQLVAAHTIYVRAKLTGIEVAQIIHERFGYRTVNTAAFALRHGWRSLGLEPRRCAAVAMTTHGGQCQQHPLHGIDFCFKHADAGWLIPDPLIAQARALHEAGTSFNELGKRLLTQTPWRSAHYLSERLAEVAARDGWHRSRHLGCHARQSVPVHDQGAAMTDAGRPTTRQLAARIDLIEEDLDRDREGSLAETIAELRTALDDLRAMVEEMRT